MLERVTSLIRLFDLANEHGQERLAAALSASSLPAAALAAIQHLQRVGHPQAEEWVNWYPDDSSTNSD